jgi:acetyl esterase/lipase
MLSKIGGAALAVALMMTTAASAREYEVVMRNDIVFAEHEGTKLLGDLYAPKGLEKAPVLVGVHGGGWQIGDRKFYKNWGTYLAKNGYAVFAIEYRLMKPGVKTWPGAVYDTKAAVQYVRANASQLGVDPERIGMIGDSAGAHLSSLVALAADEPLFSSEYKSDPHAGVSAKVKTVIGFYGVYDMAAQWEHDLVTRPRDNIVEKLLGGAPTVNRKVYFDASPLSYATVDKNGPRFLLIYGHEDDIADPKSQSEPFSRALRQAGFFARSIVVPGAGHFWSVDPVDEGFGAYAGPKALLFLEGAL